MPLIQNLYKPLGFTPLEILKKYLDNSNTNQKATYVGRLDPMAHGVQLILIDPNRSDVEKLKSLKKTYLSEVVLGIKTDTYDLMGLPVLNENQIKISNKQILSEIKLLSGEINQPYPPYSAAKVNGKALHYWAKNGLIETITIPTHQVTIYEAKLKGFVAISYESILKKAQRFIPIVKGDFRQSEILESWEKLSRDRENIAFQMATIEITCSSGTYIRQIADQLGKNLGTSAFCFDIYRTKVGPYSIDTSVKL